MDNVMIKKYIAIIFIFAILSGISYAQEIKTDRNKSGPVIRIKKVKSEGGVVYVEGYTSHPDSNIKNISYALSDLWDINKVPPGKFTFLNPSDIDSSGNIKKIFISFPESPKDIQLFIKVNDKEGNISNARLYLYVRNKKLNYLVYLSKSALGFNFKKSENFHIYYSYNVDISSVSEVENKVINFKKIAKVDFGIKYYDDFLILLYNPLKDSVATFQYFRGFPEDELLTFSVKAQTIDDVRNYNYNLDNSMPHEFGDHCTRNYFANGFNNTWISEGIGDLLTYIYLKKYYPEKSMERYKMRIDNFINSKSDIKKINLIDNPDRGYDYLLSSAAFVGDIYYDREMTVFKKLYEKLNSLPKGEIKDEQVIKILGDLLGKDIIPLLSNFSTEEAINILKKFDTGEK
jgi:hypothetical protein